MADEYFEEEEGAPMPPPPPAHGFETLVREHPVAAVISALVAGILLGRLGIL
jgi:hypothetical protein